MLEVNKKAIKKGKSHQTSTKNDLIFLSRPEPKLNQSTKKNINVIDFIKQKKRFIIENVFDLKGTREFLASKEVAMRVIKLNDEIIEDIKKNDEDSDIKEIYNTNIGENMDNIRKKVNKKISTIPIKSKFKSNKEIFLDLDLKKFKKELTKIKDKLNAQEDNLSPKPKIKSKKSKKNKKESYENKAELVSPKKKSNDKLPIINLSSKKKEYSSSVLPKHKQTQSQFLFSEINKKLMADDELNLSGISSRNMSPKMNYKSKLKDDIYYSQVNNFKIFDENIKNKINEDIIEEDKSKENDKGNLEFQINSDKESLISILSDLM